jgi:hypothetical protein
LVRGQRSVEGGRGGGFSIGALKTVPIAALPYSEHHLELSSETQRCVGKGDRTLGLPCPSVGPTSVGLRPTRRASEQVQNGSRPCSSTIDPSLGTVEGCGDWRNTSSLHLMRPDSAAKHLGSCVLGLRQHSSRPAKKSTAATPPPIVAPLPIPLPVNTRNAAALVEGGDNGAGKGGGDASTGG